MNQNKIKIEIEIKDHEKIQEMFEEACWVAETAEEVLMDEAGCGPLEAREKIDDYLVEPGNEEEEQQETPRRKKLRELWSAVKEFQEKASVSGM